MNDGALHTFCIQSLSLGMAAWLYRRPGSSKWWVGWRVNNRQHLQSTKTENKKDAEKKLREIEFLVEARSDSRLTEALIESLTEKKAERRTLVFEVEDWLAETEAARRSAGTLRGYKNLAKTFLSYLKASDDGPLLSDVTPEDVRSFLTALWRRSSTTTANNRRKILSFFFGRSLKRGRIKINPVAQVQPFTSREDEGYARRPCTLQEVSLMMAKAPDEFWRFMILSGFYLGLRMGDLICLPWSVVDFTDRLIRITPKKTSRLSKRLEIPISPTLFQFLHSLSEGKVMQGPIWPEQAARYRTKGAGSFSNEFHALILTPAGLVKERSSKKSTGKGRDVARDVVGISFHSIRHAFVSNLKASGASQAVAKALAGHSSDQISDLYTSLPPAILADAINKLPVVTL